MLVLSEVLVMFCGVHDDGTNSMAAAIAVLSCDRWCNDDNGNDEGDKELLLLFLVV